MPDVFDLQGRALPDAERAFEPGSTALCKYVRAGGLGAASPVDEILPVGSDICELIRVSLEWT